MPNYFKMFRTAIKYTILLKKAFQNLPKLGFLFEKISSGNTAPKGSDLRSNDQREVYFFPPCFSPSNVTSF
jgi:hypothetical protein